ncbi:alpha/beta hydrolase [Lewinella lacunae]|uniref:Alpha/beta hydrolase n=2 Tax=Neolewinella lacunae TaxID=1517758 RepID=A0A923T815_9BACT|nr:alpha/beta hydrolase [Neolewinella lacunae]
MKQTGANGSQAAMKSHTFTKVADVKWAAPRGFDLTMDIYTPDTKKRSYPVIIMYHGGGWLINNKSIMDEGAAYLASHGEYIVCNVNYRLLGDLENTVTMDEIVSDALGARLWVRENIAKYGGDPKRIIVTGDSAGGHLATMVATQGHRMAEDGDFNPPNYTFRPSYLPADGIKASDANVQAAIISYGAFNPYAEGSNSFESASNIFWQLGGAQPRGIMGRDYNPTDHAERYKMISPIHLVDAATSRNYPPMLFTVGSKDNLTTPASIQAYMDKLKMAGHDDLTYWVHEGRPHAFLDSGSNAFLGIEFQRDAVPALNYMLDYLNGLFYA